MQIRRDKELQRIKPQYTETCAYNREDYLSVVVINCSLEDRVATMAGGHGQQMLISTGLRVHPLCFPLDEREDKMYLYFKVTGCYMSMKHYLSTHPCF